MTNPGSIAIGLVNVVDDRGTPDDSGDDIVPAFVGGDDDADALLDPEEVWVYSTAAKPQAGPICVSVAVGGTAGAITVNATGLSCYTGLPFDPTDLTRIFGNAATRTDHVRSDVPRREDPRLRQRRRRRRPQAVPTARTPSSCSSSRRWTSRPGTP